MRSRERYSTSFVFIDLFLTLLLVFMLATALLLKNMKTEESKGKIDDKNEFVVTMVWDGKSEDDVDLWMLTPTEGVVGFPKREVPGVALANDSLGIRSNRVVGGDGVTPPENMETMNIRKAAPGRYVVNIHMYRKSDAQPTSVKVKLMKINPFGQVIEVTIPLTAKGDEVTAFAFTVDANNNVTEVTRDQELFVMDKTREIVNSHVPDHATTP